MEKKKTVAKKKTVSVKTNNKTRKVVSKKEIDKPSVIEREITEDIYVNERLRSVTPTEQRLLTLEELFLKNNATLLSLLGEPSRVDRLQANAMELILLHKFRNCNIESFFNSVLSSARINLPIQQIFGNVHLLVDDMSNEVSMQIGYKGWLVLANRCKKKFEVCAIYDVDKFEEIADQDGMRFEYVANRKDHQINSNEWIKQHLIGVMVWIKDIEEDTVVHRLVTSESLRKIEDAGSSSVIWQEWYLEMLYAKSIKWVITKTPFDIDKDNYLAKAVEYDMIDVKGTHRISVANIPSAVDTQETIPISDDPFSGLVSPVSKEKTEVPVFKICVETLKSIPIQECGRCNIFRCPENKNNKK